jgi:mannose/cellobiose epimerase-like protein (N-acyl-D-glucosamine 2-epimerase family)
MSAWGPCMTDCLDRLRGQSAELQQWLFQHALPLWWERGADKAGGFYELLDASGAAMAVPRRARVQGRQSYSFAVAGKMGWEGPWREASVHGVAYMQARYLREDGLHRTLVANDGAALDETAVLYDHAFALLGSAWIAAMLPERKDLAIYSQGLLDRIAQSSRHPHGGFRETGTKPFLSNPHMHLLEAALAWMEFDGGDLWRVLASEIIELCLTRFIDPALGAVREEFDENWQAVPVPGGALEPGHQFEWAWLLERWARLSGDVRCHPAALRLFEVGCLGIDPVRNVAVDALHDDFSVARNGARLWPQTERLKAALILMETATPQMDFCGQAVGAAQSLLAYLDVPTKGLWRDKMQEDGSYVDEPSPASSFYHIVCAILSLQQAVKAP